MVFNTCVDVIIPCVQIDDDLVKSLKSVEHQTFTNIKVYLVINSKQALAENEKISKILENFLNLSITIVMEPKTKVLGLQGTLVFHILIVNL